MRGNLNKTHDPAAMRFMQEYDWESVRLNCHTLLQQAMARLGEITGIQPVYLPVSNLYHQMAVVQLPQDVNVEAMKTRL